MEVQRNLVEIVVYNKTLLPVTKKLTDVVDLFNRILDSIPEEHKGNAQVSMDETDPYDPSYSSFEIKVFYTRDETDQEAIARQSREQKALAARGAYRLASLKLEAARMGLILVPKDTGE